jgi:hypothetical protein
LDLSYSICNSIISPTFFVSILYVPLKAVIYTLLCVAQYGRHLLSLPKPSGHSRDSRLHQKELQYIKFQTINNELFWADTR